MSCGNWQNLPHHVFGDIMTMAGRESLQNVQNCRQVCQSWNVMISLMTKYNKDSIRKKVESLVSEIKGVFFWVHPISKIITAASLAHHGVLGSMNSMDLNNVDLASVPAEHLASLPSCVTMDVGIYNVSNCDLVSILDSVKCEQLLFDKQTLSSEETQALVRAMESNVQEVVLGVRGEVILDITALDQYSGEGKCWRVICYGYTAIRYRQEVKTWVRRINWTLFPVPPYVPVLRFSR